MVFYPCRAGCPHPAAGPCRIFHYLLGSACGTTPQSPVVTAPLKGELDAERPEGWLLVTNLRQHRTIPALRLKHRSGSRGTASALPKCLIMSGCGTRIVLRGQKPLALCDRCPCFGSLFPPLAALTFAASSIICAFGLASAAPRSPYRYLELCGIALKIFMPGLRSECYNKTCRKPCTQ